MTVMTSVIPHGRPFTVDDLEGMPDDGNRYELIDGMLIVSPAPVPWHQLVLGELFYVLRMSSSSRTTVATSRSRTSWATTSSSPPARSR
jgi:Uma2 family endonuclease